MESYQKSLLQLPIDPLNIIMSKLDMEDLKNSCLVSRSFNELITTCPIIKKRTLLSVRVNSGGQKNILGALSRSNRVFNYVKIRSFDSYDGFANFRKSLLSKVLKKIGDDMKLLVEKYKGLENRS